MKPVGGCKYRNIEYKRAIVFFSMIREKIT